RRWARAPLRGGARTRRASSRRHRRRLDREHAHRRKPGPAAISRRDARTRTSGWRMGARSRNPLRARAAERDRRHPSPFHDHPPSMPPPGAIVIPGALPLAGALPAVAADDVIAAILAGTEAMTRLGRAIDGPAILYRGVWPTYFAAPFGMAAVAARLLELDED